MIPKLNNEKGLTLVEILAVLVITTIIGIIGYSILFSGISAFEKTKVETELRDEADLIMATLLNEMYVLKSTDFGELETDEAVGNYYFPLKKGELGFKNSHPIINGKSMILNNGIKLTNNTKISDKDNGQYEIILELELIESGRKLKTKSEIGIINTSDNPIGGDGK